MEVVEGSWTAVYSVMMHCIQLYIAAHSTVADSVRRGDSEAVMDDQARVTAHHTSFFYIYMMDIYFM